MKKVVPRDSSASCFLKERLVTKAATVAIASYAGPLVAVVADVIAFGQFPTWNVYIGGSIVIFSGLLLIRKTQKHVSKQ